MLGDDDWPHPRGARRRAMPRPMPIPAPVTTATRPASRSPTARNLRQRHQIGNAALSQPHQRPITLGISSPTAHQRLIRLGVGGLR